MISDAFCTFKVQNAIARQGQLEAERRRRLSLALLCGSGTGPFIADTRRLPVCEYRCLRSIGRIGCGTCLNNSAPSCKILPPGVQSSEQALNQNS